MREIHESFTFRQWWQPISVAGALILAGCAGTPEIPYDHSASSQIKSIAIVTPYSNGPTIVLTSSVGQSFGLVGALIDASMTSDRNSKFTAMMQSQNFTADAYFVSCLTDSLKAEGYRVVIIPVPRPDDKFLVNYPGSDQKIDAYFDARTQFGYIAAGIGGSNPYRPAFYAHARLVKATDSSAVLMEDTVMYNPLGSPKNMITIAPNPTWHYVDMDAMTADPTGAMSGLKDAELKSAQALAALLK